MKYVTKALKAVVAAALVFLAGLQSALIGGASISDINDGQWVGMAYLTLVSFAAVWGITNKPAA